MKIVQKFDLPKTIMLIGMMGVGKTTVGKHLARYFQAPFIDADAEIEKASGLSIKELYKKYGEHEFYKGEEKVVSRLLHETDRHILSSGGTAFISPLVQEISKEKAITIWLKADYETLYSRTVGRKHRPMFPYNNHADILKDLITKYYPIYENADIVINIQNKYPNQTCKIIANEIKKYLKEKEE